MVPDSDDDPGAEARLEIHGLTPLQAAELRRALAEAGPVAEADADGLDPGVHGEPLLTSLLVASTPAVISLIGLWLSKQRSGRTEEIVIEEVGPEGRRKTVRVRTIAREQSATSPGAFEALLADALKRSTPDATGGAL